MIYSCSRMGFYIWLQLLVNGRRSIPSLRKPSYGEP